MYRMRTKPSSYWPIALCLPLGILAAVIGRFALLLPTFYSDTVASQRELAAPFLAVGVPHQFQTFAMAAGVGAGIMALTSVLALIVRRFWILWLLHKCYIVAYLLFVCFVLLVLNVSGIILEANVSLDGITPNPVTLFFLRAHYIWPAAGLVGVVALLHIFSWRRVVYSLYTGIHDETPAPGDRLIENVLGHGRDPRFRKSLLSSAGMHLLVIFVVPWLLALRGCVMPYLVPKGSGTPQVAAPVMVKIIKKPKKKKKKLLVNPNAAISFHLPDLDESMISKEVEEATQLTHVADPNRVLSTSRSGKGGKLGAGGGKGGGWPDGMDNAVVRFIRLEYNGPDWNDGMDAVSRADRNFLDAFHELTGFKVAPQSESHPIALLRKYPKGFAPPFVYMTGSGNINVTPGELKALRDYLQEGGMLFADCGSPQWDRSFRGFARALFPGEPLLAVADDDPLFQMPFTFSNGAPPLWHHGGSRAMGIKYKSRWVVFYHPGDINDAWKTGHSGLDPQMARGAIEMGVNIIYYAFTNYLELTRQLRK